MNERQLLMKHLQANVEAIHPGRGKAQAQLIRETCQCLGLNEDDWLPKWVTRDKQAWGLE
jgi:hypothetical protein